MQRGFRHGDVIEVRGANEILATLDKEGTHNGLPFMPEMLRYCGCRFVVDKRAEKFCDTIKTKASRRIPDAVLLEDLRCDGSAHNDCHAECRIFWKESWLRRIVPGESPSSTGNAGEGADALAELTSNIAKQTTEEDGRPVDIYCCQATELYKASIPLRSFDPRPYVREFLCGNVPIGRFLRVSVRAFFELSLRQVGRFPDVPLPGTRKGAALRETLGLLPGDWVQVKTREEISATLTPDGRERGLWFDREMLPHCGRSYQVRKRVSRLVNDRNGKMIELKSDCILLEGVVCSGDLSLNRYFCARAIHPYWRESWLRRVKVDVPAPMREKVDSAS